MSVQEVGRIELRLNDACVLTNIGSGTTEQNRGFVEHGKLPLFVKVIRSSKDDVQEQTVGRWATSPAICQPSETSCCRAVIWTTSMKSREATRRFALTTAWSGLFRSRSQLKKDAFPRARLSWQPSHQRLFPMELADDVRLVLQDLWNRA